MYIIDLSVKQKKNMKNITRTFLNVSRVGHSFSKKVNLKKNKQKKNLCRK